jgi:two-component system NtrC family sensor kinase
MTPAILIVDDSLTVRMDLSEAFEAAGMPTLLAASAEEARGILARVPVELVVLDVVLETEDGGLQLLREIKSNQSGRAPYVLLLTNETAVKDRLRGLATGADDYVGKPYDTTYVIARVRDLLRARSSRPNAPPKVLVIDDSLTFRQELSHALASSGYAVLTAENGEDGLRLAGSERPAAVLVDNVMPGIDGGTVIRRMRLDAALRATPCVLLTASDDLGAELIALEAGADAFVRKEDLELILARLQAVLRNASVELAEHASLMGPKRILVIDEDTDFSSSLCVILQGEGYDVITVESGEGGLAMLEAQPSDCILVEARLKGVDGLEICRRFKAAQPDTPLLVLSENQDRDTRIDAFNAGADDFLSKRTDFEVLKARVRAQLRRKQLEDERRSTRERLLRSEREAGEARAARQLSETRAKLVDELERKNDQLSSAYRQLQETQMQLVQSAKMASLGELVAGVAHEINNPLAFVISHLGTVQKHLTRLDGRMKSELADEELAGWDRALNRLREMGTGLERMRELVVKLRTFSRLDEGERKTVSLRSSVESLLTILGHRLKDRIRVETRFGEPDFIDCYPGLLNQALMNLVANAIDAIDGQGVIVIASSSDPEWLTISVTDNGQGIPEELRHRVVDPFFTTKPVGQGTGLGLSITDSIVRKHAGTLELLPNAGGGTEARIRIPRSMA